jgi:hypothetical protein
VLENALAESNATNNDERPRAKPSHGRNRKDRLFISQRKQAALVHFSESRHELSMPNLFEGAKEVSLPLLWDLQVDINWVQLITSWLTL